MKKILLFLLITNMVYSQNIKYSKGNLSKILCKTWIEDYATIDGEKVDKLNNVEYVFKDDGNYILNEKSGTWSYDSKSKSIFLYLNSKLVSIITTLNETKFIMVFNVKNPKDRMKFQVHFKVK